MKANLLKSLNSLCQRISSLVLISLILLPVSLYPSVKKAINEYSGEVLLKKLCSEDKNFKEVVSLSKNKELKDSQRWILIMAMTKMGGASVIPNLKEILNQKESSWYIRSAVVKALGIIREKESLNLLHKMLNDPSLVVRTFVVKSIADFSEQKSFSFLVKELKSPKNFHKGQSLWIRKHLIEAIAKTGGKKAIPVLISYLDDTDKNVALKSKDALLSIVHNGNIEWSKRNWLDWWKHEGQTKEL